MVVLAISKHTSLEIIKSNKGWMKTANILSNYAQSTMGSLRSTLAGDPALPTSAVSDVAHPLPINIVTLSSAKSLLRRKFSMITKGRSG